MDRIEILDLIVTQLQSPQEFYDQDLTPMDRVIYKMKLDMVKVNTKVDQILEKSRPKTPAQPLDTQSQATKPSYAETLQSPGPSLPPSPRVVIPVRKEYRNEPIASREPSQAGTLRARRLILKVSTKFLDNLNPMRLRDQINDNFFMTGINEPVIAIVGRSTTNLSLVITTMERYSGSFLLEKEAI